MEQKNLNNKLDNRKHITISITHNFALFLIGVIIVGLVAIGSYTFLNFIGYESQPIIINSNNI